MSKETVKDSSWGTIKGVIHFARQRIHSLKGEIDKKTDELAVWNKILEEMKPCKECDGEGSFRVFIAQDETEFQECEKCKGKGVLS